MAVRIGVPHHEPGAAREYRSEYVWTRRELRRAAAAAASRRHGLIWHVVTKSIGFLLSLVCILALVLLLRGPDHEFRGMFLAMYGLFLVIGLGLCFQGWLFVWLNSCRSELRSQLGERVVSVVTAAGIRSVSLGTDALVSWKAFQRVGVTGRGVILSAEGGLIHWLPRDSFAAGDAWEAVRELALRHAH